MKTKSRRNEKLQELARFYLSKLRDLSLKYGLRSWVDDTISANERGECVATEEECMLLSRVIDDERVSRSEIPLMLGKSYRSCCEGGIFDKLRTLPRVGIYSKVSVLLFSADLGH